MKQEKEKLLKEIREITLKLRNKELSEKEGKKLLTHFNELGNRLFEKYGITVCPL